MWVNATRSETRSPTYVLLEQRHIVSDTTLYGYSPFKVGRMQRGGVGQKALWVTRSGEAGVVHHGFAPEILHKQIGYIRHARRLARPPIDYAAIAVRHQLRETRKQPDDVAHIGPIPYFIAGSVK